MNKWNSFLEKIYNHKWSVHNHIKKHHKKYLLWAIGWAAVFKIWALMIAWFGILNYGLQHNSFADIEEINFNNIENAELNTEYYSETWTLNWIETGIDLSIDNWRFRINTWEWTNQTWILYSGDIFQLKAISSNQYNTTNITTRHLNEFTTEFQVTTKIELDTEPESFYFDNITWAELDTGYVSNMAIISDINTWISISAIWCEYKINTGDRETISWTIYSWDIFYIKIHSAKTYNSSIQWVVVLWTFPTYFSVTTKNEDKTIEQINFKNITGAELNTSYFSNKETILWINTWVFVEIQTWIMYSINSWERTNNSWRIYNQDNIKLSIQSDNEYNTTKTGIISIWTGIFRFSITTKYFIDTGINTTWNIDIWSWIILSGNIKSGSTISWTGDLGTGIIFTWNLDYNTGTQIRITKYETWNLLELFKTELKKYQGCKKNINIQQVEIKIKWWKYEMDIPQFKSKFLSNISAVFSKIIIEAINIQSLNNENTEEIITDFNNFLVVLKLLRDGDSACSHNLSNYYINKFQDSLEKYKIFGEK